jgi:hypothetical protein
LTKEKEATDETQIDTDEREEVGPALIRVIRVIRGSPPFRMKNEDWRMKNAE